MDLSLVSVSSQRLLLRPFAPEDAVEVFAATTPTFTRYMGWEPPPSLEAFAPIWQSWSPKMHAGTDIFFVVRLRSTLEFVGMAGLHDAYAPEPEAGIWIKECRHGHGYGREAVAAVIACAGSKLGKPAVVYPVVLQNGPSRRLAESLGGTLVGTRTLSKPDGIHPEVVYRIPATPSAHLPGSE